MFTRDRINRVLEARGYEPDHTSRPHDILDMLDTIADVDTWGGSQFAVFSVRNIPVNSVGTRVALHEELIFKPPPVERPCNLHYC